MEERKLRTQAAWFLVAEGELYKRSVQESVPTQTCVLRSEGKEIATSIHKDSNRAHQGESLWPKKDIIGRSYTRMPRMKPGTAKIANGTRMSSNYRLVRSARS